MALEALLPYQVTVLRCYRADMAPTLPQRLCAIEDDQRRIYISWDKTPSTIQSTHFGILTQLPLGTFVIYGYDSFESFEDYGSKIVLSYQARKFQEKRIVMETVENFSPYILQAKRGTKVISRHELRLITAFFERA
ncbi:hypothetical protein BCON_0015g00630 [Botryotinia convoluta]|uniref:Uncharacterized protein n=1 Tax=Botryotinia convoluta TaxID=54673 RepID=A0A4Z1IR40_9HELO|nr:hypothetical protein BCON_0015g00630 [Botryotinia convoluta]